MKNNRINQAVIFSGGFGTRLKFLTKKTPKPLLEFDNVKFLDYVLLNLFKYGFKDIIILCHFKYEKFFKYYHNKKIGDMKIQCIKEKEPLGTGGALFNIKKKLKNIFIVCNGDTYIDFNIISFLRSFKNKNILVGLQGTNDSKFKKVIVKDKLVKKFSNQKCNKNDLFNTGYVIMRKSCLKFEKNFKFNLEFDFFNNYIQKKRIHYFNIDKKKIL